MYEKVAPHAWSPLNSPPQRRNSEMRSPMPAHALNSTPCGPTGALLIGDAKTVARKILYVNKVLARWHLPGHIPNECLNASAPKNVGRHRNPRHRRGTYRPERTLRHHCSRLMIRTIQTEFQH